MSSGIFFHANDTFSWLFCQQGCPWLPKMVMSHSTFINKGLGGQSSETEAGTCELLSTEQDSPWVYHGFGVFLNRSFIALLCH